MTDRAGSSLLFPDGSIFNVDRSGVSLGRADKLPNDQSFDLAVLEFEDNGILAAPWQLTAAAECIEAARKSNRNGALVVLFVHGWHHGGRWDVARYIHDWDAEAKDDQHFRQFRRLLMALSMREAERYSPSPAGRRVVGLYLAWNGDPQSWIGSWLSHMWGLRHLSFYDRYGAAEMIGGGGVMRDVLERIVGATKMPVPELPESPLILCGHSMGGLVMEAAFLALLREQRIRDPLIWGRAPCKNERSGVNVRLDDTPVAFPDLVLSMNSAAHSGIAREILGEFRARQLTKRLVYAASGIAYSPPLLVSMTSSTDTDTGENWQNAQVIREIFKRDASDARRFTSGHDIALRTHDLMDTGMRPTCSPRGFIDFGQDWHCLRYPVPPQQATPSFDIDLPEVSRNEPGGPIHHRYTLVARLPDTEQPAWFFLVPPEIIRDHNDVFNMRSSLLALAMMQISGAVVSLAEDTGRNFE